MARSAHIIPVSTTCIFGVLTIRVNSAACQAGTRSRRKSCFQKSQVFPYGDAVQAEAAPEVGQVHQLSREDGGQAQQPGHSFRARYPGQVAQVALDEGVDVLLIPGERAFQGRNEQTLFGRYEPTQVTPAPGDMLAPADQPLGRLLFTLLEPRSDDGFANWGFLADRVEGRGGVSDC